MPPSSIATTLKSLEPPAPAQEEHTKFHYEVSLDNKLLSSTDDLYEAIKLSLAKPGSRIDMTDLSLEEAAKISDEDLMWKMMPVWVKV